VHGNWFRFVVFVKCAVSFAFQFLLLSLPSSLVGVLFSHVSVSSFVLFLVCLWSTLNKKYNCDWREICCGWSESPEIRND